MSFGAQLFVGGQEPVFDRHSHAAGLAARSSGSLFDILKSG
ncbi:hypothetical protein BOSEA31B_11501 [Hyphomicrobiales bacterium]|nr:hypothetical protein BOSEA31B_11501 [Hyphomicrobiales bacterium]